MPPLTTGNGGIMDSGRRSGYPSVRPSVVCPLTHISHDAISVFLSGRRRDFKWNLQEISTTWRFSGSEVRGQGHDPTECYSGGGMHFDSVTSLCYSYSVYTLEITFMEWLSCHVHSILKLGWLHSSPQLCATDVYGSSDTLPVQMRGWTIWEHCAQLLQGYRVTGGVLPADPDCRGHEPLRKIWVH